MSSIYFASLSSAGKGVSGGPLRLPTNIYEITRIPPQEMLISKYFDANQKDGEEDSESSSVLGDNKWWIIIGCVFALAILLIVIILIFICTCRPSANARLLVRMRNW